MAADLETAWDALVDDLRHATFDAHASERLVRVGTTCVLRVQGHEHLECVLRFDERPPEVEEGPASGPAEIEVDLPPACVKTFWETGLALAIMRGGATYRGPVRRLLSIYPILRAQAEQHHAARAGTQVGAA